jgi:hypothetical protein
MSENGNEQSTSPPNENINSEKKSYKNTAKENLKFLKQKFSNKGKEGMEYFNSLEQKVDASMNENILLAGGVLNTFNNIVSSSLLISKGSGSLKGYGIFNLIIYIFLFLFFCYYTFKKFNNQGEFNKLNNIIFYIIIIFTLISIIVYGVYIKDENISDESSKGYQVFSNFLNALTLMMITLSNVKIESKEEELNSNAQTVEENEGNIEMTELPSKNPQQGGKRKIKKRTTRPKKKPTKKRR